MNEYNEHKDKDYLRNDLDDAAYEEVEDRIVEESRKLRRPLNMNEVSRMSRGRLDSSYLNQSVLSGAVSQHDLQNMARASGPGAPLFVRDANNGLSF